MIVIAHRKKIFLFLILMFFLSNKLLVFSLELPKSTIIINTSALIKISIKHDNSSIVVKKIISNIGLGYAIETNKDYPKGEKFNTKETAGNILTNIILCGYPTKNYIDLNLLTEEDAYFATQVAIWCALGQYDISKLTGDNTRVMNTINNIYTDAKSLTSPSLLDPIFVYKTNDKVKEIIMVSNSKNNTN